MTKKFGFTLAEVLITLGIIGVVAAMTIPTLIANTNSAKFKSGFKKAVSTLSQAALMGQAQWDTNYAGIGEDSSDIDDKLSDGKSSLTGLFNNTLSGVTISKAAPTTANGAKYALPKDASMAGTPYYATLADGSLIIYSSKFNTCERQEGSTTVTGVDCIAYIDVNGPTLPNKLVNSGSNVTVTNTTTGAGVKVPQSTASVANTAAQMTDIYPVFLHDGVVEPATAEGKYVLSAK